MGCDLQRCVHRWGCLPHSLQSPVASSFPSGVLKDEWQDTLRWNTPWTMWLPLTTAALPQKGKSSSWGLGTHVGSFWSC